MRVLQIFPKNVLREHLPPIGVLEAWSLKALQLQLGPRLNPLDILGHLLRNKLKTSGFLELRLRMRLELRPRHLLRNKLKTSGFLEDPLRNRLSLLGFSEHPLRNKLKTSDFSEDPLLMDLELLMELLQAHRNQQHSVRLMVVLLATGLLYPHGGRGVLLSQGRCVILVGSEHCGLERAVIVPQRLVAQSKRGVLGGLVPEDLVL
jgi:hypothetical protein